MDQILCLVRTRKGSVEDNDVCDGRPGGSHPREGSLDERTGRPSTQVTHATQVRIAPRWLDMGSRLEPRTV
jgi:hypothetical protein